MKTDGQTPIGIVEDVVREGGRAYLVAPRALAQAPARCELREGYLLVLTTEGASMEMPLSGWMDPAKLRAQAQLGALWLRGAGSAPAWSLKIAS